MSGKSSKAVLASYEPPPLAFKVRCNAATVTFPAEGVGGCDEVRPFNRTSWDCSGAIADVARKVATER